MDVWLAAERLLPSRARAQAAIAAGLVKVNGHVVTRAAHRVGPADVVEVTGDPIGYVGRGGMKLAAALDAFGVSPHGRDCLDVGASTGGFTDCLLQRGAKRVLAVDVGQNQLHPHLQRHAQVWALEETDIRDVRPEAVQAKWQSLPDLAVVDVAFISVALVLPAVAALVRPGGELLVLVKPQFEVGRAAVGKGGIVRDAAHRQQAVEKIVAAAAALGLQVNPAPACRVTGGDGNEEYFVHMRKPV